MSLDQWFSTGDIFGCTIKWMAGMLLAFNRGMLLNSLNTQDSGHIKKLPGCICLIVPRLRYPGLDNLSYMGKRRDVKC